MISGRASQGAVIGHRRPAAEVGLKGYEVAFRAGTEQRKEA
jgi:hypothetical protein